MKKILSFCAALLIAIVANAATINIGPGESVAEKIAAAEAGDVFILADGTYEEGNQILFYKDLTLQAAEGAHPIIAIRWYCEVGNGADVTIKGIKFDGTLFESGLGASDHFLRAYNSANGTEKLTLEDCEINGFPNHVIYFQKGSTRRIDALTIKNCYFHDNARSAIYAGYDGGNSVNSVTIENSTFANHIFPADKDDAVIAIKNAGSEVDDQAVRVDHCTFYNFKKEGSGSYTFIDVRKSTDVAISNCIFAQPSAGMSGATYCYGGTIDNCLIFNTTGHRSGGCVVSGSIEDDPKFADAENGDYTLADDSPAIGAATDASNLGDPRWWPGTVVISATPTEKAPVPAWPADQVKSLYSDTYDFAPASLNSYNEDWWNRPNMAEDEIESEKFLHYFGQMDGMIGWQFGDIAVTNMEYLHVDIWPSHNTTIKMGPTSPNAENPYNNYIASIALTVEAGKWNSFDIPVADLLAANPNFTLADIMQNQFTEYAALTDLSVDNVFFYRTSPYVDTDAPTNFEAEFVKASFFSATIKASAEDACGAVAFVVKDGDDNVLATATAASGEEAIFTVPGLAPSTAFTLYVTAKDDNDNETAAKEIEFTTAVAPAPAPAPDFSDKENVVSLFCDERDDNVAFNIGNWGQKTQAGLVNLAADDEAWYLSNMNYLGWELTSHVDVSAATHLHIDFYATDMTKVSVTPISPGHEGVVVVPLTADEWTSVDIELSEYTGDIDWSDIFQVKFMDATPEGTELFIDNVFFFAVVPPIDITINTGTSFTDAVADEGWWQVMAENDEYLVSLSNISTTEIPGTYPMSEMDADYSYVRVKETDTKIHFDDGEVVVTVNADNSIDFVGLFLAEDGNYYALNLHYGAIVETTKDVTITNLTADLYTTGCFFKGSNDEDEIAAYLFILGDPENIIGDYTAADIYGSGTTSGIVDGENGYAIFSASLHVALTENGYTVTGEVLCTNNVQYNITMSMTPEDINWEYSGAAVTFTDQTTEDPAWWQVVVEDGDMAIVFATADGIDYIEGTFTLGSELDEKYCFIMDMTDYSSIGFVTLQAVNVVNADGSIDMTFTGKGTDFNNYTIIIHTPATASGIENAKGEMKTVKVIKNGQLIINHNGKNFNAVGARVE